MPRNRAFLPTKQTGGAPGLRLFYRAMLFLSFMTFSGCGLSNKSIDWKSGLSILRSPPSADIAVFETNTEAGVVTATSPSFQLSKGTGGGNYNKLRSTSANFVLTGGAVHAL